MSVRLALILPDQDKQYLASIDPILFRSVYKALAFKDSAEAEKFFMDHIYDFVVYSELNHIPLHSIKIEYSKGKYIEQETIL